MPTPNLVAHSKFPKPTVLYDDGDFSVAAGNYTEAGKKEFAIGMRWNGGAGPGYPRLGKNPVWFIVTPKLAIPILAALLQQPPPRSTEVVTALKEMLKELS